MNNRQQHLEDSSAAYNCVLLRGDCCCVHLIAEVSAACLYSGLTHQLRRGSSSTAHSVSDGWPSDEAYNCCMARYTQPLIAMGPCLRETLVVSRTVVIVGWRLRPSVNSSCRILHIQHWKPRLHLVRVLVHPGSLVCLLARLLAWWLAG